MMEVASIAIYGFPTKPSTWTEIIIAHQRKGKAMDDLISRQAAIEALTALEEPAPTARHLIAIYDCEDAIKALPSAQPDARLKKIADLVDGTIDHIIKIFVLTYCKILYIMTIQK